MSLEQQAAASLPIPTVSGANVSSRRERNELTWRSSRVRPVVPELGACHIRRSTAAPAVDGTRLGV